jgi:hypothetical protein
MESNLKIIKCDKCNKILQTLKVEKCLKCSKLHALYDKGLCYNCFHLVNEVVDNEAKLFCDSTCEYNYNKSKVVTSLKDKSESDEEINLTYMLTDSSGRWGNEFY